MVRRSVTISARRNLQKLWQTAGLKKYSHWEILTGRYFGIPLYAKVEIKEMHEQKIAEIEGEFKKDL